MQKSFFFFIISVFIGTNIIAQGSWVDVGMKAGFGPTFIVNNNVWNDKKVGNLLSYGNMLGGRLGFNFNEYHQILTDVMKSTCKQKFSIKASDSLTYKKEIQFSTLDISFLYRSHTDGGGYIEVGPQYSMVKAASQTIQLPSSDLPEVNVLDYYNKKYYAVVFGFGANFMGGNNFSILLGARMAYGLNDLVNDKGGKNQLVSFPMNDDYYDTDYKSYKSTKPLSALLVIEATYDVGFWAHSKCGKGRSKFISFD